MAKQLLRANNLVKPEGLMGWVASGVPLVHGAFPAVAAQHAGTRFLATGYLLRSYLNSSGG